MSLLWHDRQNEVRMAGPTLGAEFTVGYSLTRSVWLVGRANASLLFADRVEMSRSCLRLGLLIYLGGVP